MTNEAALGTGRPIVATVVVTVAHGKALRDFFGDTVRAVPESAEIVFVDVRAADALHDDLRRLTGASDRVVRVLSAPAASRAEARNIGIRAARGRQVLVVDESIQIPIGLLREVLSDATGLANSEPPADVSLGQRLDLVRDLQKGLVQQPDVADFLESAIQMQAERIREILLAEPDRHVDVVVGVRVRQIADFPWSTVNHGRACDLAILHNFVPFIDTSGLVAARRLREWGVVRDVVSQDLSHRARVDDDAMRICAEVLDQTRVLPGKRLDHRWRASARFTEGTLAAVGDLQAAKGRPYRSVYSRAMPPASHFAAAVLKLRTPGLRWVAEFSDPLLMNAYGEVRNGDVGDDWLRAELAVGFLSHGHDVPSTERLFGWAELVAYAFADEVIFTNEHQRDFMLGYCADRALAERARGITTVMHHPVPGPELYSMARADYDLAPGKVHVGYFGTFYANRGLSEVTVAIDALTSAERAKLQLHVFTNDPDVLRAEVLEAELGDVITVGPMLGYLEYLNLITRFDVLLLNDYATSPHYVPNPYLPAKLADYRGSGSRIWALYEPGSVLSATDLDHATELGDAAGAAKELRKILELTPSAAPPD